MGAAAAAVVVVVALNTLDLSCCEYGDVAREIRLDYYIYYAT